MAFRHHKLKRPYFLISKHVHPQTMSVVETRASAIGVTLKLFDGKSVVWFKLLKFYDRTFKREKISSLSSD